MEQFSSRPCVFSMSTYGCQYDLYMYCMCVNLIEVILVILTVVDKNWWLTSSTIPSQQCDFLPQLCCYVSCWGFLSHWLFVCSHTMLVYLWTIQEIVIVKNKREYSWQEKILGFQKLDMGIWGWGLSERQFFVDSVGYPLGIHKFWNIRGYSNSTNMVRKLGSCCWAQGQRLLPLWGLWKTFVGWAYKWEIEGERCSTLDYSPKFICEHNTYI